ncbi:hypothetical protein DY000_02037749 [Brassica cretica]|uniref:RNase H type-1 domain-containing protein n=1 Tax=Brassica cretica TaxID=69181 RepID=A0ABQ7B7Q0_BRACR|nr:hypothetical protein DY000_02037749 [Brassica cretica]
MERIVPPQERNLIERVQIGGPKSKDVYVWNYTKTCHYSVKSRYWVQYNEVGKRREPTMMNQPSFDFLYQLAWKSKASPKPTMQVIFLLLSQIPEIVVQFSPRGGNKAADRIAKEIFTYMSNVPKLYSVEPSWLKFKGMNDISMYGEPEG